MTSLDASNVNRPVEHIRLGDLAGATWRDIGRTLEAIVDYTATDADSDDFVYGPIQKTSSLPFVKKLLPGIEKVTQEYHCGNFVMVRGETQPFFETMPLSSRLGMELQCYLQNDKLSSEEKDEIKALLYRATKKQGETFNNPNSKRAIPVFIKTYSIQLDEVLHPDLSWYKNLNDFFSRELRAGSRPIQNEEDPTTLCSVADSRLTVYPSVDLAKEFWLKGNTFTIPKLLNLESSSPNHKLKPSCIAIFRLTFADYHRFHSPIDCVVREIHDIPGEYYTVNPQAVNEPDFHVLTSNERSVLYLTHLPTGYPVAIVAVGSLLVGSINWTGGKKVGSRLKRGDELGYFAYGGSTVVAIFPTELISFDDDLVSNSETPIETLVKVGYSIGKVLRG